MMIFNYDGKITVEAGYELPDIKDIYDLIKYCNDYVDVDNIYFATDDYEMADKMNFILGDGNIFLLQEWSKIKNDRL